MKLDEIGLCGTCLDATHSSLSPLWRVGSSSIELVEANLWKLQQKELEKQRLEDSKAAKLRAEREEKEKEREAQQKAREQKIAELQAREEQKRMDEERRRFELQRSREEQDSQVSWPRLLFAVRSQRVSVCGRPAFMARSI